MNRLDLLAKSYSQLHNYQGIPYWAISPFRKIVRFVAHKVLPSYLAKSKLSHGVHRSGLLVSFTSFPTRANDVWKVVECMKRQTYMPDKILLWLSKEQFPTSESVPKSLRDCQDSVFEIRMVDGDIRSHKKYFYVSSEYPDSLVFLIDDDIYYPTDIIERSVKALVEHPNSIICNYGYHIGQVGGEILPYKSWRREYKYSTDADLFFGSGGGTLFKPSNLYVDLTNIEKAIELTPIADDIWLNAMVRLARIPICLLDNGQILPTGIENNVKLAKDNISKNRNDVQLKDVINYYIKTIGINPFKE